MLEHRALTERIIGLAIDVHRTVGPGLLETVYQGCLCLELEQAGIPFQSEVTVPVVYKGTVPDAFKAGGDIVVDGRYANGVFTAIPGTLITKCPSKYAPKKS